MKVLLAVVLLGSAPVWTKGVCYKMSGKGITVSENLRVRQKHFRLWWTYTCTRAGRDTYMRISINEYKGDPYYGGKLIGKLYPVVSSLKTGSGTGVETIRLSTGAADLLMLIDAESDPTSGSKPEPCNWSVMLT